LATKVVDTVKKSHGNIVESTLDRSALWQAQTPQMYRFTVLSKALKNVVQNNLMITDEASGIEYLGLESVLVEASKSNLKILIRFSISLALTQGLAASCTNTQSLSWAKGRNG
jgi:2-C-methyl-D-erythritol 4-phosphate cytidylyltransferase